MDFSTTLILLTTIFYLVKDISAVSIPRVRQITASEPLPLLGVDGRDTLKLECSVGGNPFPTISWTFNGTEVVQTNRHRFKKQKSNLLVEDVTSSDSGRYKCIATNVYGSVFGEIRVTIPSIGSFKKGYDVKDAAKEIIGTIGRPLTIECPPHTEGKSQIYYWGDLPSSSLPIIWKAGRPIPHAFVGSHHGALYFSYLTENDIKEVSKLNGISCIIYQEKHSIQSVRYKIKADGPGVDENSPAKLATSMEDNTIAIEGKKVELICGATGKPQPRISWFKNDKLIYDPDTKKITGGLNAAVTGEDMELSIHPVTKETEGVYKCVAKNDGGEDSKEGTITMHSPATWDIELKEKVAVPYQSPIELKCKASGFPDVYYEWYHNNTLISSNVETKIVDGSLTIMVSEFIHSGIYMCVAVSYLNIIVSPCHVQVEAIPPKFQEQLQNPTYFFKRHTNYLYCNATAGPEPIKKWYRDDVELKSSVDRFSVFDNGSLVLDYATVSDKGTFKCVAKNIEGTAETEAQIKVVEKTVITKPPASVVSPEGYSFVQLFCDAEYEKTFDVTFEWWKDGLLLSYSDRLYQEKRLLGPSQIISFKNLELNDNGDYTCRVYTRDGTKIVSEDKKIGSISVIANPAAPSNVVLSGNCLNGSVRLSWEKSKEYVALVKYYVIEYAKATSSNMWYKYDVATKSIDTIRILKQDMLPRSTDLIFRVKAIAMYNKEILMSDVSKSTASDLCITTFGSPTVNPTDVKSVIKGEGELIVTWKDLNEIDKPGPEFEYTVSYSKLPDGELINITVSGDTNQFQIPNPGVKEKYEVLVRSKNKYGLGPVSTTTMLTSGEKVLNESVKNVKVKTISFDGINVEWDPLPGVKDYRIFYTVDETRRRKRSSESTILSVDTIQGSSFNLTGLQSNKNYKIAIAGLNINGPGPRSTEVTIKTAVGVPEVPTNVNLIVNDYLKLSWNPPSTNKEKITSYTVFWYKKDDTSSIGTKTISADSRELFITDGLDPMTYYNVELVANSDAGKGEAWKIEGIVVGRTDIPGKPSKPTIVVLNQTALKVMFNLPVDYVGAIPRNFTVYYTLEGENNNLKKKQPYPSEPWLLLNQLENRPYIIWTAGENSMGEGAHSDKVTGSPLPPSVPVAAAAADPFYTQIWFIILIVCIVLLIVIVLLMYLCCNRRGGKYPVGEKESARGGWDDNQPLKDYTEIPMDEQNGSPLPAKKNGEPVRSVSQNSISKPAPFDGDIDDDGDSLDDYGEDAKFDEDGSFIGQYGDESKSKNEKV